MAIFETANTVRKQSFTCTEDEMNSLPNKVLALNEKILVRMNDGTVRMKLGDGVTGIAALPYVMVAEKMFVRYSMNEDGTDFTDTWSKGMAYIGQAAAIEAPTDKADYQWLRIADIVNIVNEFGQSEIDGISQKMFTNFVNNYLNIVKVNVSGNPIKITDASESNYSMSVKVSGVDDVENVKIYRSGKNAVPYPFYETTKTINGITFTDNGDGTITANGTATAQATFTAARRTNFVLPKKSVFVSGCPSGGGASTYQISLGLYNDDAFVSSTIDYGTGIKYDLSDKTFTGCTLYCIVSAGAKVENVVFKPQIELVTEDGEYEPFVTYDIYTPEQDGEIKEVKFVNRDTWLLSDNVNVIIDAEYNKNINTFDTIVSNIEYLHHLIDKCSFNQNQLVKLVKSGDNIFVRSSFGDKDIVISSELFGSQNKIFNFNKYYTISHDTNDFTNGEHFKNAVDDIAPIYFKNSYRGGNHGDSNVYLITEISHGLDESHIGRTMLDNDDEEYIILQVPNENTFVVGKYDESTGSFVAEPPVHLLTDGEASLSVTNCIATQLKPAVNHVSVKLFNDGGKEIWSDGEYGGRFFDVSVSYDIPTVSAVIEYLRSHVGSNTNLSCASDDITGKYCTVNNIYRFTERGAVTEYQTVDWYCSTPVVAGFIQSAKIGNYYCVPHTAKSGINELTLAVNITKDLWDNADCPPDRFYQFNNQNAEMGFCVGYNTEYGSAIPSERENLTNAMRYETTGKMYPYLKNGSTEENFSLSAITFRTPIAKYDDDFNAVSWYYVGDDIYLLVDVQKTVNKYLSLPSYMNGRKVELVKSAGSISVQNQFVTAQGVKIIVNHYGSAIIKLMK